MLKDLLSFVSDKYEGEGDVKSLVSWLFDEGLLKNKQVLRILIKRDFDTFLRSNDGRVGRTLIDLSLKYFISVSTVKNIVYRAVA